jgi:sortase A
MKKHPVKFMLACLLFAGALLLLSYSISQILMGPHREKAALQEWDKLKCDTCKGSVDEDPVLPVMVPNALTFSSSLESDASDRQLQPGDGQTGEISATRKQKDGVNPAAKPVTSDNRYPNSPVKGDVIGALSIPRLKLRLAVIEGTDSEQLAKGVGHYPGTAFPGTGGNAVLAGHRDTIFRGLGKLQPGDRLDVETVNGKVTYIVKDFKIVKADDRSVIVPRNDEVLTLITCYPFYYVGPAPDRYIVTAVRQSPE